MPKNISELSPNDFDIVSQAPAQNPNPTHLSQLNPGDFEVVEHPIINDLREAGSDMIDAGATMPPAISRVPIIGGIYDQASAGISALGSKVLGSTAPLKEIYEKNLSEEQTADDDYSRKHPIASGALTAASSLAIPFPEAKGAEAGAPFLTKAATFAKNALKGTATNAAVSGTDAVARGKGVTDASESALHGAEESVALSGAGALASGASAIAGGTGKLAKALIALKTGGLGPLASMAYNHIKIPEGTAKQVGASPATKIIKSLATETVRRIPMSYESSKNRGSEESP